MEHFKRFLKEEDGAGVVEMILIIVVLIGIVLIFKEQLTDLVNDIFDTITKEAGRV
uniref:Flp1 family type IVb pilin n=1 Tax=Agathobacter sp. TaxID=2021311 RepID=UPI0040573AA5